MFEKKTRGDLIIDTANSDPFANVTLDYAEAANAEIDRLNYELTALRAQVPAFEKVTGKTFPVKGVYFVTHKSTGIPGACLMAAGAEISEYHDCHLILTEKDFPKPPKPELEVKVGKYDIPGKGVGRVVWIDGDSCWFINPAGGHQAVVFVDALKELFEANNARFIGEGDNQ